MKILVDENIPLMSVRALRDMGHEVWDVRGSPDEGMSDDELWRAAQREGRLMITTDKGFSRHRGSSARCIWLLSNFEPGIAGPRPAFPRWGQSAKDSPLSPEVASTVTGAQRRTDAFE